MLKKIFGVDKMVEQEKQQYLDAVAKLERQQKKNEQLKQIYSDVLNEQLTNLLYKHIYLFY